MGLGLGKSVLWLTKLVATTFILLTSSMGFLARAQPEAKFKCGTENATCHALIDYMSQNSTTLRDIQKLFNVKHLPDIVGVNPNTLPSNASGSYKVSPNVAVKVPFPCRCGNDTGLSDHVPLYKIKPGDGLDAIARSVFAGVVKYQQIQVANKIPDANKINAGDTLWIPLPCSCDPVGGSSVVHYAHIVAAGNTVEGIAQQFGTTQEVLLTLNGINDPKSLQAGQVLDVPLKGKSKFIHFTFTLSNWTVILSSKKHIYH